MMTLNGAHREVEKIRRSANGRGKEQRLTRRLQYFNDMNFVYGDGNRDKYTVDDLDRLKKNADEYIDNCLAAGEPCYMSDFAAYVQKDDPKD